MSSAATVTLDHLVDINDWMAFCKEHEIIHSPQTIGGNTYYWDRFGGVEVTISARSEPEPRGARIRFSHFFMGELIVHVARLALEAWARWGGELSADPEIRNLIRGAPDPHPERNEERRL